MSFFATFVLSTLPAGISTLLLLSNKKEVDAILLKYDADYTPQHNVQDILKIFKAYKGCRFLEKKERKLLLFTMLYIVVGFITIIIWVILFLFFPNYVFGD
jgi:hypothetical protein